MKARPRVELPPDVEATFARAMRLEWLSLVLMISTAVLVYATISHSQAMKAVFVEDALSLIPPIAFLITGRIRWRTPNERFPYGYHRSVTIGYLCSAVALLSLGLLILFEALMTLVHREHPSIGVLGLFGHQIWIGWLAYPVLLYSIACEYTMGRMKQPLAKELHDKTLAADGRMNRADWMTGVAAMLGMTGIAFGWWWADAVTAALIAFEIVRDGWENLKEVLTDIMDEVPTKADEEERADWAAKLRDHVRGLDWVRDADVRLREEGNLFTGEVYVVPRTLDRAEERGAELIRSARALDWRFYELELVLVEKL
ncbi:MAG: cation diffusion facilitator family transporter [Acidobacteria bacterium]|nr:cation diffusion facilitator family transporter [Acidobacteriota bacterium]MBV9478829.1 cation diffusion facilitator family transporter [Acidobacteriota bacterium]